MKVFTNLNELIKRLYPERKLLYALFQAHMKFNFRYEEALDLVATKGVRQYNNLV